MNSCGSPALLVRLSSCALVKCELCQTTALPSRSLTRTPHQSGVGGSYRTEAGRGLLESVARLTLRIPSPCSLPLIRVTLPLRCFCDALFVWLETATPPTADRLRDSIVVEAAPALLCESRTGGNSRWSRASEFRPCLVMGVSL